MTNQFQGGSGNVLLVETLKNNCFVLHNDALARKFAAQGELVSHGAGEKIIEQGGADNDLYLILSGTVEIFVNQRFVTTRTAGSSIGEMAVVDPTTVRSATVVARSEVTLLKVTASQFNSIAGEFPQIWRPITLLIAARLRHRDKILRPPNSTPVVLLICSPESQGIANEIQAGLRPDPCVVNVWTQGVFGPAAATLDVLRAKINESDFAVFVFSQDDPVMSRGHTTDAPRDNAIFDLGLIIGVLGRKRTFIVTASAVDPKIPGDLLGITTLTYAIDDPAGLAVALEPACTALHDTIVRQGPV